MADDLRWQHLAPWAVRETRGRRVPEAPPSWRSEFQRDRDRIIHSGAFRRLEYKTQVFLNHEGDLFRTRLTHSLEVAQIARTMARALQLNEDLVEALALAHDLGHTPFGHAGQEALNDCLREHGGFEHNLQSLRVVDTLEQRYAEFDGLNLTFEAREGILKRCAPRHAHRLGEVGQRFIDGTQPSLEAQLTNLADEIAYNSHDVDDGLRAGLLELDALVNVPIIGELLTEVRNAHPRLEPRRTIYQTVRRLISAQVDDLIRTSREGLSVEQPEGVRAVRARSAPLIIFSDDMAQAHRGLKHYLFHNLYRHYRVHRMTTKAKRVIVELFEILFSDPRLLPPQAHARTKAQEDARGERGRARAVADYIAGMTDRYAIAEHERLHDPTRLA